MPLIRRATVQDAPALLDLVRDFTTSFTVDPETFDTALVELLADPNAYLVVTAVADEVVGYLLGFDHATFFANGRVAWVEEIAVRTDRRRSGIGRALMRGFETWAAARGARLVALATRRASDFYRTLGYEESAVYYRKLLDSPPEAE